jgi:hypothetical protein
MRWLCVDIDFRSLVSRPHDQNYLSKPMLHAEDVMLIGSHEPLDKICLDLSDQGHAPEETITTCIIACLPHCFWIFHPPWITVNPVQCTSNKHVCVPPNNDSMRLMFRMRGISVGEVRTEIYLEQDENPSVVH